MKKMVLSILIIWQLNSFAQTSIYHHFPASNALWTVEQSVHLLEDTDPWTKYNNYSITGDTVISSAIYHKVWNEGIYKKITGWTSSIDTGAFSYYAGAMREDTISKKVYFIPPSHSTEELMYDFSVNVGDTVRSYLLGGDYYLRVATIDSILVGGQYRKKLNLDWPAESWDGASLIEGVGSTFGLLEYWPQIETIFTRLDCFSENSRSMYPYYDSLHACSAVTSIKERQEPGSSILISPNPSEGQFQLKFKPQGFKKIEIVDVFGNMIYSSNIKTEIIDVDLSNQPNGIYFMQLKTETSTITKKIIINK